MSAIEDIAREPNLDDRYAVSDAQLEQFRRDGHVRFDAVLSPAEVAAYRDVVRRVVARHAEQRRPLEKDVDGPNKNWQFIDNMWTLDPAAKRLVHSRRLARIAATLLGVDRVRLYRDQSYFKGPGGVGTPWHQDAHFMPIDTDAIVTAWIPFTRVTPESAPMMYATGSHRAGFLGVSTGGGEAVMRQFEEKIRGRGYDFVTYDDLHAGDVAFHYAWTMHGTYANASDQTREAIVIVYFADGAHVVHDTDSPDSSVYNPYVRQIRAQTRAICLPGLAHGAPAAGPMTPLVYDRSRDDGAPMRMGAGEP